MANPSVIGLKQKRMAKSKIDGSKQFEDASLKTNRQKKAPD
ncbi:hypothetical protein SynBIOSE41_03897 [Synechococcus sp. BIOS-E4-1]|nr:hypothetical protein SynBIOSE41_03897 [Synechococcus sp. BIOS-E4-1]